MAMMGAPYGPGGYQVTVVPNSSCEGRGALLTWKPILMLQSNNKWHVGTRLRASYVSGLRWPPS